MAEYKNKLVTSQEHDVEFEWELEEPLVYVSDIVGPIVVPSGFVNDKNSVPWYMRWLFPVSGRRSDYAATIHDWLYSTQLFDKVVCDEIYLEAMLTSKVPKYRAIPKYKGVLYFGDKAWEEAGRDLETLRANRALILSNLDNVEDLLRKYDLDPKSHHLWNLFG